MSRRTCCRTFSTTIGSATSAYAIGNKALFVVDNGSASALYLFGALDADSQVESNELTLLAGLANTSATTTRDLLFGKFLADHTNVQIHYTPSYSSWLNQVENWFSRIQRDVISRGIFTSVKDLDKKLMRTSASTTRAPSR